MRDVVNIAGGGLAGLALASGLRLRGIPVEVHEAGSYPRHRVCGEFISGVDEATLGSLGLAGLLDDARQHHSVAWFRGARRIYQNELAVPASGISRHRLDLRLKERVQTAGGAVIERARVSRRPREGWVWAAGRIPRQGGWIGLKCHFHHLPMGADLEMHLGENGYVGLAGIEDGKVNVCGLFRVDRTLRGRGAGLLLEYLSRGGNASLAGRLGEATPDESSCCAVAGFELGRQPVDRDLCAVGDAESMIPPFTGNGMSMAFEAAEAALDPLESWSRDGLPWAVCSDRIRDRLRRKFRRRLLAASAMHPMLLRRDGRAFIEALSRTGTLPFKSLMSLVR